MDSLTHRSIAQESSLQVDDKSASIVYINFKAMETPTTAEYYDAMIIGSSKAGGAFVLHWLFVVTKPPVTVH